MNWYSLAIVLTIAGMMNPVGLITRENIVGRQSREVALDTNHILRESLDSLPTVCKYAPSLKAAHPDEYDLLVARRFIPEIRFGIEYVQDYDTQRANVMSPKGLSSHYTLTNTYKEKYLNCLQ